MPRPVVLEGEIVRLEPLGPQHVADLFEAHGQDDEIWLWMQMPTPRSAGDLGEVAGGVLADPSITPLAVILRETGRAVGWTAYMDAPGFDTSVEIGWTWYGRRYWRTAVNTECKLLLLTHAFEELGFRRVQLKTDVRNERSQAAIRRLGAVYEGTLRRHWPRPDGTFRDSVYFSVLDDEWPPIKERLTARLARG
jgi:RimJ/RimL family protein N-acetyltransferase